MCDIIGMQIAYQLLCWIFTCTQHLRFENYVNYAGSKIYLLIL